MSARHPTSTSHRNLRSTPQDDTLPHLLNQYLSHKQRPSYLKPLIASFMQNEHNLILFERYLQASARSGKKISSRALSSSKRAVNRASEEEDDNPVSLDDSISHHMSQLKKQQRLNLNQKILRQVAAQLLDSDDSMPSLERYLIKYMCALIKYKLRAASQKASKQRKNNSIDLKLALLPLLESCPRKFHLISSALNLVFSRKKKSSGEWECIAELVAVTASMVSQSAEDVSAQEAFLQCFSCIERLVPRQQQQRSCTSILKDIVQMIGRLYHCLHNEEVCEVLMKCLGHILEEAKDSNLINRCMVMLCELYSKEQSTTEIYPSLLHRITNRIQDERKTVRLAALKALHVLMKCNLATGKKKASGDPPKLDDTLHEEQGTVFQQWKKSCTDVAQHALGEVLDLLAIMAENSHLCDKKVISVIEDILTDKQLCEQVELDWTVLTSCMQHSDEEVQTSVCKIVLAHILPHTSSTQQQNILHWSKMKQFLQGHSLEQIEKIGSLLERHMSQKHKLCTQRTLTVVASNLQCEEHEDQLDRSVQEEIHVQLRLFLLFSKHFPLSHARNVICWCKSYLMESQGNQQILIALLSDILKQLKNNASYHEMYKQLRDEATQLVIGNRFETIVVHQYSVTLLVTCFQNSLVPLYNRFYAFEEKMKRSHSTQSLRRLLSGIETLFCVVEECWRFQSDRKWRNMEISKQMERDEDLMIDADDSAEQQDDYLLEHREQLKKDMFFIEFRTEMMRKSFISRYIQFAKQIADGGSFDNLLQQARSGLLEEENARESASAAMHAIAVFGMCVKLSPEANSKFVQHIYSIFESRENGDMDLDTTASSHTHDCGLIGKVQVCAFQQLCQLMAVAPNLVEEKIESIFARLNEMNSTEMSHCVLLLCGDLCIQKMFRNQKMTFHVVEYLLLQPVEEDGQEDPELYQRMALSFLKNLFGSSEESDTCELAISLTLRFVNLNYEEHTGEFLVRDACSLMMQCLRKKDRDRYLHRVIEELFFNPSVLLTQILDDHVPHSEKAAEFLTQMMKSRGLYFFKKMRDSKTVSSNQVYECLKDCAEKCSKRFRALGETQVDSVVKAYMDSKRWRNSDDNQHQNNDGMRVEEDDSLSEMSTDEDEFIPTPHREGDGDECMA